MLKTIAIFSTDIEAELIKGKLESSGIDSFIFKDDCGGMRPHMQLTDGVQLKVNDADFETAKVILAIPNEEIERAPAKEIDVTKHINHLLHRARGWILVGVAIIPGLVSFPISFIYSIMAHNRYNESGITDGGIKNSIIRIQFVSALFSTLSWLAAIYYMII
jgi:hypothetical protein